ncbi:MAG: FIST C-terminal domain-containing protein [Pseudomonadota bacterium]|nr:FIST C-terminal domain-containing protein [Pseudomonadota bacterium]
MNRAMGATPGFATGWGADRDWRTAVAACLERLEPVPERADLGFLYVSDHLAGHASDILTVLRGRTGVDDWTGTTGIGVLADGCQLFDTPGLVAMLATVGPENRRLFPPTAALPFAPWFGVLHADPRTPDLPQAIAGHAGEAGGYWVGGLTATRGASPMIARGVRDGGMAGVAFSEAVAVQTGLSQGCTPIGPVHEITRGESNLVVELDGRPAFEVLRAEMGEVLVRNLSRVPGFIFAGLPVSGVDRPDYLVRDLVGFDPGHGVIAIGGEIATGERLMFCRRDAHAAATDMTRMLDDMQGRLDGRRPKAGLYYSCLGRGPNMFPEDRSEIDMIAERFGGMPLAGFFCNGEVSNGRLYTYTGVLSLFV